MITTLEYLAAVPKFRRAMEGQHFAELFYSKKERNNRIYSGCMNRKRKKYLSEK
ncbi:MAG: hypothetical protein FWH18_09725 [Marinilabiliaceae bacterium]|nr:hypothetical protein [Marinilabiliaceae bacterium]